jgi:hypothetical protein
MPVKILLHRVAVLRLVVIAVVRVVIDLKAVLAAAVVPAAAAVEFETTGLRGLGPDHSRTEC